MRLPLAPLLVMMLPMLSFAQNSFKPGYVVTNNADTVKGYIEEGNENAISEKFVFKKDPTDKTTQKYTPADAAGFGFYGGNRFIRVTIDNPVEKQPNTVFAKALLKGYNQLFTYVKTDRRYFIIKTQEDSTYLLYDDFYTYSGSDIQRGNFKNVLMLISKNCEKLKIQLERLNYSEADILSFIKQANNCIAPGSNSEDLYVRPKGEMHFTAYAGGIYLGEQTMFNAKLQARYTLPSVDKKNSLNVGLHFLNMHKNKNFYYSYGGATNDRAVPSMVTTQMVSVPVTLQHYFTNGHFRPYLEAGFCYVLAKTSGELNSSLKVIEPWTENTFDITGAAGIDYRITPNIGLKAEWRYEYTMLLPSVGVTVTF
jgi:opacity protein-like surface antigen